MKVDYDTKADTAYIYLVESRPKVAETRELSDEIFVDYAADGQPLGIEIIGVKDRVPTKTLRFLRQHNQVLSTV